MLSFSPSVLGCLWNPVFTNILFEHIYPFSKCGIPRLGGLIFFVLSLALAALVA